MHALKPWTFLDFAQQRCENANVSFFAGSLIKSQLFQLCLNTTVFCEFCTDSTFTQAKHKSEMDYLCGTQQSRPVNNLT